MSIQLEIDRINQNVASTYAALEEAGATMPTEETSANLAATAATLALTAAKIIAALGYTPANADLFPVATAKIANAAVTRAKLAQDALYSPRTISSDKDITTADMGIYLTNSWSSASTYTLTQANSAKFPLSAELPFIRWGQTDNATLSVITDGIRVVMNGHKYILNSGTKLTIPDYFGSFALKKMTADAANGDLWLALGNVEVVE